MCYICCMFILLFVHGIIYTYNKYPYVSPPPVYKPSCISPSKMLTNEYIGAGLIFGRLRYVRKSLVVTVVGFHCKGKYQELRGLSEGL